MMRRGSKTPPLPMWRWRSIKSYLMNLAYLSSLVRYKYYILSLMLDIYSRKGGYEVYVNEDGDKAAVLLQCAVMCGQGALYELG